MSAACSRWREALAMQALGALPAHERAGLVSHLDGCAACRDEAGELVETASLLGVVDTAAVEQAAGVPPALTGRVLGELHHGELRVRRRRHAAVALVGAAVAAAVVAIVAVTASGPPGRSDVVTEHLIGPKAAATVTLAAKSWGTSVTLTEQRSQAQGVYTVSMRTASGGWWPTGSYRGVPGRPIDAQMTCAVPLSQITGVRVTNASGTTVLWSEAASVPHWG